MFGIRRREFISLLGGAAACPLAARAQQPAIRTIGFLSSRSPGESANLVAAFRRGLREGGFVEGQNAAIAFRWAEGRYERLAALAAELVELPVAVLFTAGGPPSAFAAKAATQTIPVVFSAALDPDRIGLVASLSRPGGNLTGMSLFPVEIAAKSVQLLKELAPSATLIGYLVNPSNPAADVYAREASNAARSLGITIHVVNASTEHDLDEAFVSLVKAGAGGLISYGASLPDAYRQGGISVGRILKGEKPANLPVMQPTKFDLVLNLKAAKALGLNVPDKLLALADEVIE